MEMRKRVQAGATAWMNVGRVKGDRPISRKPKGKVFNSCIALAYLHGLETIAMTEKQQERLQVCENNWVRKIARGKGIDKRRTAELREEFGVKESHKEAGGEPAKVSWTRG